MRKLILLVLLSTSWVNAQEVKIASVTIDVNINIETSTKSVLALEKAELIQKIAYVPKRQVVLTGPVDANGQANFLTSSGLTVTVNNTSEIIATAAEGFDSRGTVDYIFSIPTATITLPVNDTSYIYAEYNKSGYISVNYTDVVPVYSYVKPTDAEGLYWFNLSNFKMYKYVDSTWSQTLTVFLGEAVTDGSAVTSVLTYAYLGRYDSGWISLSRPRGSNFVNHRIGTDSLTVFVLGAADANGLRAATPIYDTVFASVAISAGYDIVPTRLTVDLVTYDNFRIGNVSAGYEDVGFGRVVVNRSF